jgi:uncharacterized membrane protein YfcA
VLLLILWREHARLSVEAIRRNERRKLSATWCNGAATGVLTVGGFAPIVGGIIGVGQAPASVPVLVTVFGSSVASVGLHLLGREILERLEE